MTVVRPLAPLAVPRRALQALALALAALLTPGVARGLPGRPLSVIPCDSDRDGLPDALEDRNRNRRVDPGETSPLLSDTDRDGLSDGVEDANANGRVDPGETSPTHPDSDGDGLRDGAEDRNANGVVDRGETDPRRPCTDPQRPCATREDVDGAGRGPRIPEPMVIDLVRGLGARRGELEVNALAVAADTPRGWEVRWAPEVEWVAADGLAFEAELPMVNGTLEAVKLAAQVTFGTFAGGAAIHGAQVIAEGAVHEPALTVTAFYLLGARWSRVVSALLMLGADARSPLAAPEVSANGRAHGTLFFEVLPRLMLAMELGARLPLGPGGAVLDATPQVRWRATDHVTVQLGAGAQRAGQAVHPLVGGRVAVEW